MPVLVPTRCLAPLIGAPTGVAYGTSCESVTKPSAPDLSCPQQRTLPEKIPQLWRADVATVAASALGASAIAVTASASRTSTAHRKRNGARCVEAGDTLGDVTAASSLRCPVPPGGSRRVRRHVRGGPPTLRGQRRPRRKRGAFQRRRAGTERAGGEMRVSASGLASRRSSAVNASMTSVASNARLRLPIVVCLSTPLL